jgi:hypothetical protein
MPSNEFADDHAPLDAGLIDWASVYDLLGMRAKYDKFIKKSKVELKRRGLFTIPVLADVTCAKIIEFWESPEMGFNALYPRDVGKKIAHDDRDPTVGPYVVSFGKIVRFPYMSSNLLVRKGIRGITAVESMLLDLGRFSSLKMKLCEMTPTLCNGSRFLDCSIPCTCWDNDLAAICLGGVDRDKALGDLCVREVVDFIRPIQ